MPIEKHSAEDFQDRFLEQSPTGPIWPRERDATFPQVALALVQGMARVAEADVALIGDAFPATAVHLLPEWEATLGLPDRCAPAGADLASRQAAVAAAFTNGGGQSAAYFVAYAARLGFSIAVRTFVPSRFGRPFGRPFGGDAWAFAWQVAGPAGAGQLRCLFGRMAPAHTTVTFDLA